MASSQPMSNGPDPSQQFRANFQKAIASIQSVANFAAFSPLQEFVDPDIHVPGIGKVNLPLQEETARSLVKACHQAPFGKGEQTLVDMSVRNTLELNADQFELRGRSWGKCLGKIARSALKQMGFDEDDMFGVRAELYKLLLYQEGAMFKPHKDTEKVPGMFGTLVICLPSPHKGGCVKLQHSGKAMEFRTDNFSASYASWYSDVLHEIVPVTKGYRLVLTFNLTSDPRGLRPSAMDGSKAHAELGEVLKAWQSDLASKRGFAEGWVMHRLEHKYTVNGMKMHSLKGKDLDVVRALRATCDATGFLCFLASSEKMKSGGCDEDDYGYRKYHEIIELFDESFRLKQVVDMDGNLVAEDVTVEDDCFVEHDPFGSGIPDEEDFEGYTGNEGTNTTHWYRSTVVVIASKSNVANFLLHSPPEPRYGYLPYFTPRPRVVDGAKLLTYLEGLLAAEPDNSDIKVSLGQVCRRIFSHYTLHPHSVINRATQIAAQLGDYELVGDALSSLNEVSPETVGDFGKALGSKLQKPSLEEFKTFLGKPMRSLKSLRKRYAFVHALIYSLQGETANSNKKDIDAKIEWLVSKIVWLIDNTNTLLPEDAETLFDILGLPYLPSNYLDRIHSAVENHTSSTLFMINYLEALGKNGYGVQHGVPSDRAATAFSTLLPKFLHELNIPQMDEPRRHSDVLWATTAERKTIEESEALQFATHCGTLQQAGLKLLRLHEQTLALNNDSFSRALPTALQQQAETVSKPQQTFIHVFLPFLRGLHATWRKNDPDLMDSFYQTYFCGMLRTYLTRCVGAKPREETTWARTPVQCGCADCECLNEFIRSATQRVGRFPMGSHRRAHLHQKLEHAAESYDHVTEHVGNPHTLVVTKSTREVDRRKKEWKRRREEALKELALFPREFIVRVMRDVDPGLAEDLEKEMGGGDGRVAKKRKIGD